jgi:molybdenum cofactor cytidylyltransferase
MPNRTRIAAAILAAGQSNRMGSPKALILQNGIPSLQHLIDRLQHPRISARRIVLGTHADEIRKHVRDDPRNFLINPNWEQGQLSSLQIAIRSLDETRNSEDGILVWPVDHFLVTGATVGALIEGFLSTEKLIAIPTFHGRRGHPVIFAKQLYAEFLEAPLDVGARAVVRAHATEVLELPTEEEAVVLNLNDPETLKRVLSRDSEG